MNRKIEIRCRRANCNKLFMNYFPTGESNGLYLAGIELKCEKCKRVLRLAEYSMLSEERYVTYAVEKNQISELGLKSIHEVPNNEEPVCIVQEVGYILPFKDKKAVDPLSLSLMLSDADMEDPRVENCLNEMLEDLIW